MATISIDRSELAVEIQGLDRLWCLKRRLTIPLEHVRGATTDPGIVNESKGRRALGTYVPGVIRAGLFYYNGQRVFWDVHDKDKAVVIDLVDDSYRRLVIEVEDPRATVELIEAAIA